MNKRIFIPVYFNTAEERDAMHALALSFGFKSTSKYILTKIMGESYVKAMQRKRKIFNRQGKRAKRKTNGSI